MEQNKSPAPIRARQPPVSKQPHEDALATDNAQKLKLLSTSKSQGLIDFNKMQDKSSYNIHQNWEEAQKQGHWESRPFQTPHLSPNRFQLESEKLGLERDPKPSLRRNEASLQYRSRDFTSQIDTIPGPRQYQSRKYEEQQLTPNSRKPLHALNQKIHESYYFKAQDAPNAKPAQPAKFTQLPFYQSYQKKLQELEDRPNRRKFHFEDMLYRTPRDFLTSDQNK